LICDGERELFCCDLQGDPCPAYHFRSSMPLLPSKSNPFSVGQHVGILLSHDVAVETDRGDCCRAPRSDNTLRTMSDNCPSDPVRPSALPCQSEVKFYVKQATSRSLCMPSDESDRLACKFKYISYTLSILWEKIKSCIEHDFWRGKIGNSLRKIRPKETLDCPKNINVCRFADVSP
jgi:hypothetical protein